MAEIQRKMMEWKCPGNMHIVSEMLMQRFKRSFVYQKKRTNGLPDRRISQKHTISQLLCMGYNNVYLNTKHAYDQRKRF